ncbi:MAG: hypothetical protein M3178_19060 [Pseudomonadota bacterium]|nr:hypothetical protein [Pseudomonadota bacterium]
MLPSRWTSKSLRQRAGEPRLRDRPLLAGVLWVMDMVFRDDEFGIRTGHAPANFTAPPRSRRQGAGGGGFLASLIAARVFHPSPRRQNSMPLVKDARLAPGR